MPEQEKPKPSKAIRRQAIMLKGMTAVVRDAQHVEWAILHADTEFGQDFYNTCCPHDEMCALTKMGVALIKTDRGEEATWLPLKDGNTREMLVKASEGMQLVPDDGLFDKGVMTIIDLGTPTPDGAPEFLSSMHDQAVAELSRAGVLTALTVLSERMQYGVGNFALFFLASINVGELLGDVIGALIGGLFKDLPIRAPSVLVGIGSSMAYIDYLKDEYGPTIRKEHARILEEAKKSEESVAGDRTSPQSEGPPPEEG